MFDINMAQLSLAITMLLTWVMIHLVARVWSPKRLFFIHLGREMSEEDKARSRRVVIGNSVVCFGGAALALLTSSSWMFLLVAVILPWIPFTHLFVEVVGLIRSLSSSETKVPGRYAIPMTEQPSMTSYLSAPLTVAQVVVILMAATLFLWLLPQLPAEVPMHWNAQGEVDRYGSPRELWFMLPMLLFDYGMVWIVAWSVSRERWALPEKNAEEYTALQRRRRATIVSFVQWIVFGINVSVALMWLFLAIGSFPGQEWLIHWGIIGSLVLMSIGIVVPFIVFLPPMIRIQDQIRQLAGSDVLGTRPDGWRAGGMIYYAPDDPALFVPKKIGIGQTVNFGRPGAWIFIGAIIFLPLILTFGAIAILD